jgi:hypothetical protein
MNVGEGEVLSSWWVCHSGGCFMVGVPSWGAVLGALCWVCIICGASSCVVHHPWWCFMVGVSSFVCHCGECIILGVWVSPCHPWPLLSLPCHPSPHTAPALVLSILVLVVLVVICVILVIILVILVVILVVPVILVLVLDLVLVVFVILVVVLPSPSLIPPPCPCPPLCIPVSISTLQATACRVLGVVVVVVIVIVMVVVPVLFLSLPLLSLHCNHGGGGGAAAGGSMVMVLVMASSHCPLLLLPPLPHILLWYSSHCRVVPSHCFCHPGDVVPIFPGAICMLSPSSMVFLLWWGPNDEPLVIYACFLCDAAPTPPILSVDLSIVIHGGGGHHPHGIGGHP